MPDGALQQYPTQHVRIITRHAMLALSHVDFGLWNLPIQSLRRQSICHNDAVQPVTAAQDFEPPSGKIKEGIEQEWGSLDDFIAKFNPTTAAVQVC